MCEIYKENKLIKIIIKNKTINFKIYLIIILAKKIYKFKLNQSTIYIFRQNEQNKGIKNEQRI